MIKEPKSIGLWRNESKSLSFLGPDSAKQLSMCFCLIRVQWCFKPIPEKGVLMLPASGGTTIGWNKQLKRNLGDSRGTLYIEKMFGMKISIYEHEQILLHCTWSTSGNGLMFLQARGKFNRRIFPLLEGLSVRSGWGCRRRGNKELPLRKGKELSWGVWVEICFVDSHQFYRSSD